jgi:serine/threonine-protein kinase
MALEPGRRLGPYEIVSLLGAGGTNDPERLARFRNEAQLLAALNHPNIAHVYGLDEIDATHFLVMELVDGESLDKRIARGRIPVDDALLIARQIAEALETAHDKGIIHRDLKPANIALTNNGTVKVLDFGLAKAMEPAGTSSVDVASTPTTRSPAMMTGVGTLLGTAAYMSPEQARGRPVDRRTDIWAYGCVLYEMLTGRQAFDAGESMSDAVAAILRGDIDWTTLPPQTPPTIVRLLRRCLQKDVQKRLPHIGLLRLDLDEGWQPESSNTTLAIRSRTPTRSLIAAVATATVIAGTIAGWAGWKLKTEAPAKVVRFDFSNDTPIGSSRQMIAAAPDGSAIAFEATPRLLLRRIDDIGVHVLTTEANNITNPTFSPDGRWVAFSVGEGAIKKVSVYGGTSITVCPIDRVAAPYGISWDSSGILFEQIRKGIFRVSPNGGTPELVAASGANELLHAPQMLPEGRTLLMSVAAGTNVAAANWHIVAQSLSDGAREDVNRSRLGGTISAAWIPAVHKWRRVVRSAVRRPQGAGRWGPRSGDRRRSDGH